MAEIAGKFDREELWAWLGTQSQEVSVAIAARCALRVLPLLHGNAGADRFSDAIVLPAFRATSLAFPFVGGSKDTKMRIAAVAKAAAAAANVAYGVCAAANANAANGANADPDRYGAARVAAAKAEHAASAPAANAAFAALSAANAAADDAATNNAANAADAAIKADTAAYASLSFDRRLIDSGQQARDLMRAPLWHDGLMPEVIATNWEVLRGAILLNREENWQVWTDWYEDRLTGAPPEPEVLAVARCTLIEPMWQAGAQVVNAAIRKLIDLRENNGPEDVVSQMVAYRQQYSDVEVHSNVAFPVITASATAELGPQEPSDSAYGDPHHFEASDYAQQPPLSVQTYDTDYVSDRPESDRDLLNRSSLAFALAHNINKIWTAQTELKKPKGWCRRTLDWLHFEQFTRQTREPDEAAFILHLDAPWGGGKTTFANFVARILNPTGHGYDIENKEKLKGTLLEGLPLDNESYWPREFATRRWFVVNFNAWQNEHVSPPWWNFYVAMRHQCLRALLFEAQRFGRCRARAFILHLSSWLRFQIFELFWKACTPQVRNTLMLVAISVPLFYLVIHSDWFIDLTTPPAKEGTGASNLSQMLSGLFSLTGIAVTGGAGLVLVNAFRSGLKTLIDSAGKSANAPVLGEADPIQKFRRHFSWFVSQLNDPILVIVDDLDRCSPKYVVELMRGLLTISRSPRVVFVLLGDKDWIETAFAKVYKEMADVHTDAQITFGGRFAEKAIQLSFLLPKFDHDTQEAYLTALLATGRNSAPKSLKDTVGTLQKIEKQARDDLAGTDQAEEQEAAARRTESFIQETITQTAPEHRETLEKAAVRILNRERMLRAATARSTEAVVRQHGLKPLIGFLPANPRRIKRIINMVSAYQASAQSTQGVTLGSDQWKQLVIWVVIISEYPQIWRTLVTDPALSTALLALIKGSKKREPVSPPKLLKDASDADKAKHLALTALLTTEGLTPLLRGDPFAENEDTPSPALIDAEASAWLRRLTPID